MSAAADPTDAQVAESLLAFWADGGVDAMLLDEPLDRIEAGKVMPPPRPVMPAAPTPVGRVTPPPADIAGAVAQAQALAAGATTLDELVAAIAGFEGCPLRFEGAATKAVVYRGAPDAPVIAIGEGPGAEEDARGEPFVGRSGQLLDRMFAAAGLTGRVLITNSVFWRPPGNRDPSQLEQAVCAPFLDRLITIVRPRMLLLIGAPSARSVLKREEGIMRLRGRWFEWRSGDESLELPAMPMLHPAFLLRQPGAKKLAWSDLLTLTERLDRPERPN